MAEIPNVHQLYADIQYARMFLNAASREDDPERQVGLAAIGQGFAQLAQVEATWLSTVAGQEPTATPEPPVARPPAGGFDGRPTSRLDLRASSSSQATETI